MVTATVLVERVGVLAPDRLQQLLCAQVAGEAAMSASRTASPLGKLERPTVAPGDAGQAVKFYPAGAKHPRQGAKLAPSEGAHSHDRFG